MGSKRCFDTDRREYRLGAGGLPRYAHVAVGPIPQSGVGRYGDWGRLNRLVPLGRVPYSLLSSMKNSLISLLSLTAFLVHAAIAVDSGGEPPASPEVSAAMQPYLNTYKMAGIISLIADRDGKVRYKNLTGSSELQRTLGADAVPLKARALSSVTAPLQWQPGDRYQYGNQGMNIAARIVEIVSGTAYESFSHLPRWMNCGRNKPVGRRSITAWVITCATACSATTARMAPIFR